MLTDKSDFVSRKFLVYQTAEMKSEKNVEWTNDMTGGPTRTLPRSGGERRPNRHGVNASH
jgi:hypothetical protein